MYITYIIIFYYRERNRDRVRRDKRKSAVKEMRNKELWEWLREKRSDNHSFSLISSSLLFYISSLALSSLTFLSLLSLPMSLLFLSFHIFSHFSNLSRFFLSLIPYYLISLSLSSNHLSPFLLSHIFSHLSLLSLFRQFFFYFSYALVFLPILALASHSLSYLSSLSPFFKNNSIFINQLEDSLTFSLIFLITLSLISLSILSLSYFITFSLSIVLQKIIGKICEMGSGRLKICK